jgi:hypothetical protein
MTQLISALVMGHAGVGTVEFGAFVGIIAIMLMFVVETVRSHL